MKMALCFAGLLAAIWLSVLAAHHFERDALCRRYGGDPRGDGCYFNLEVGPTPAGSVAAKDWGAE